MAAGTAPGGTGGAPARAVSPATRNTVQVGIATTLALVVGEVVSAQRWYWAVIVTFMIFIGVASRGDLLTRTWTRLAGTITGVLAGIVLAGLVGTQPTVSLVLVFVCLFFAIYLQQVSQTMMPFWMTATMSLFYSILGQFTPGLLVLRIEESAVGIAAAALAACLVLPLRTRDAFGQAADVLIRLMDEVVRRSVHRLCAGPPDDRLRHRARDMETAADRLRERARPLALTALPHRVHTSHQRALRVLLSCEHYSRDLTRVVEPAQDPTWALTLAPAADRVLANLEALRMVVATGRLDPGSGPSGTTSAGELIDAAEAHAAGRTDGEQRRIDALAASRLLRRIDQAVVGLSRDLGLGGRPAR